MGDILSNIFFGTRNINVLFAGLDNCGKTTLVYRFTEGAPVTRIPTLSQAEEAVVDRENNVFYIKCWDLGGMYVNFNASIKRFCADIEKIVYIVDSSDHSRLDESKKELHRLMTNPLLEDVELFIVANKRDKENILSVEAIVEGLELHRLTQAFTVLECSAVKNQGVEEILEHLGRD